MTNLNFFDLKKDVTVVTVLSYSSILLHFYKGHSTVYWQNPNQNIYSIQSVYLYTLSIVFSPFLDSIHCSWAGVVWQWKRMADRLPATIQTQWEDRIEKRGEGGGHTRRSVLALSVHLTTQRCTRIHIEGGKQWYESEVCMCRGRGSWGCRPLERKIGNNVSARVKSKYLQGFNLHWERWVRGVGQRLYGRREEHGGAWVVIRQTAVD